MSPLPGWTVIPPRLEEHHRPVAAQTMTAMCTVRRPSGPPPYPRPEGWVPDEVLWTGMCRLQALKREASPDMVHQPTETRQYLVALPFENGQGVPLPPLKTGQGGDTVIVRNREFQLKQPMTGSILWENDFIALENQTQQNPA